LNLILFPREMRFRLNNSSIQKKEVKLENKRNRYFLCFYRVDEHKLESTANDKHLTETGI
jgi:hypothetical protein